MAISKYNHALDHTVLALAAAANGDYENAGKLLIKASQQHDVKRAVAILEASNQGAFDQVMAARKATVKTAKTGAAKRISAATQVKAFDLGDEEEIDELVNGDGEDFEPTEAAFDEDEEEDEDENFNSAFASVLNGMKPVKAKNK